MKRVIKLTGDKALDRKLKRLAKNAQKNIMRPAIRSGLPPIRKQIKALAEFAGKYSTGLLRTAIKDRMSRRGAEGRVWVNPTVNTEHQGRPRIPRYYAHFLEFGTRFMAAQPFMRPGFDAALPTVMARIRATVAKKLAGEARRK